MWRLASRLATVNHLIERNTLIHSRMKYKRSWQHLLFTVQSDYSTVTNCTRVVSFFQSFKLYAKAFKRPFQILSHDTSIWSISWYVWLFKPALSQLWVRSHWGRVTAWRNLSFEIWEKKLQNLDADELGIFSLSNCNKGINRRWTIWVQSCQVKLWYWH